MDLAVTNIVEFRGGARGVVVGWKDNTPSYIVGARYTNPIKSWNDKGRFRNKDKETNDDIVKVYDGSSLDNPTLAFRASLKLEELPLVWETEK